MSAGNSPSNSLVSPSLVARRTRSIARLAICSGGMRAIIAAIFLLCSCVSALRLTVPRRQVVSSALSAAALLQGPLPVLAKSKTSVSPNKQCNAVTDPYGNVVELCAGAKKKETTSEMYKQQKASMAGDKGSRGTELDKDFTKLESERKSKTKTAPKQANRNRDPKASGVG